MLIKMKISIQAPFQLHPQQIIDSIIPLVDMAVVAIMHIYMNKLIMALKLRLIKAH